jgi:hypothetical protein
MMMTVTRGNREEEEEKETSSDVVYCYGIILLH